MVRARIVPSGEDGRGAFTALTTDPQSEILFAITATGRLYCHSPETGTFSFLAEIEAEDVAVLGTFVGLAWRNYELYALTSAGQLYRFFGKDGVRRFVAWATDPEPDPAA